MYTYIYLYRERKRERNGYVNIFVTYLVATLLDHQPQIAAEESDGDEEAAQRPPRGNGENSSSTPQGCSVSRVLVNGVILHLRPGGRTDIITV